MKTTRSSRNQVHRSVFQATTFAAERHVSGARSAPLPPVFPIRNHESPINGLTLAEETRHRRWIPCLPPLSLYTHNLPRRFTSYPTFSRHPSRNTSKVCSRVHSSLTRSVVEILHEPVTRQCPSGNFQPPTASNLPPARQNRSSQMPLND